MAKLTRDSTRMIRAHVRSDIRNSGLENGLETRVDLTQIEPDPICRYVCGVEQILLVFFVVALDQGDRKSVV